MHVELRYYLVLVTPHAEDQSYLRSRSASKYIISSIDITYHSKYILSLLQQKSRHNHARS